ncbi:fatty acyl-CoA synthetase [Rhodococcus sp. APC 3903]|uniref:fatty acyl-CoA synthetase n=1 Tax=Rhodococcus sp. APC 3903 TaxID=3035193 RepID=UPI0025B29C41|nr:fatty acyl-CoA synthetase [Rhodococcus sp. APC 3903]MDN3460866.1 fatty acyl-CoA synthetase [Rhodococcus sp. APC 3903]
MMTTPTHTPLASPETRSSTVDDVLARSARRTPQRNALHFADRVWTYRELDNAVSRGAAFLTEFGLAPQAKVATYGRNSDAYLIAFLSCARAGLVNVPVNYALSGDELSYILDQSEAELVLSDPDLADRVGDVCSVPNLPLHSEEHSFLAQVQSGPVPTIDRHVDDRDIVQLLYTSGTTSKPKGAMMTHRALVHEYASAIHALDYAEGDTPLHAMPLYHSAGMHIYLLPYLAVGAINHLLEAADIPTILKTIEARSIGAIFLAPTVWVPLSQHPDFELRDLSTLRKALYGASIMPQPVLATLQVALPELGFYNAFGQSELGPVATVLRPEEHHLRPTSCGRPVLNVEIRVVDADGDNVEPGERGEILYRSPQLCLGYWKQPAETADAFRDGWFHSGDLVEIDAEGYITVVDRIKDVINTGGVLVASREVEDALYTHPAVTEVAVLGTPDDRWIEAVTAFVVTDRTVDEAELIAHAKTSLAPYKIPKRIRFVDTLPRNASGKLLKRELRLSFDTVERIDL